MNGKRAVVLGVEGLIGSYVRAELLDAGWEVAGVARRPSSVKHDSYTHVQADLLDAESAAIAMEAFPDASHVFYAGFAWTETKAEEVTVNRAMLANGVAAVERWSPGLGHVCLFEGGKWYGCHIGPFKTPAYEDDARVMPPIFYYDQQDYLEQRQADGAAWTWSALRPEGVGGAAVGTPQNFLMILFVYAAICRELGLPLRFPGAPECRDALYEMSDARLLARAAVHTSTSPECANEAYNVTNGDSFRWGDMFVHVAELMGMEYGGIQTMSLVEMMADKEDLWEEMVRRHGLAAYRLDELVFWQAGDNIFNQTWDNVRSTIKLRNAGFADCIDSRQMVSDVLDKVVEMRLIPPSS